jgi:uncharacterized protein (DUF433 family)
MDAEIKFPRDPDKYKPGPVTKSHMTPEEIEAKYGHLPKHPERKGWTRLKKDTVLSMMEAGWTAGQLATKYMVNIDVILETLDAYGIEVDESGRLPGAKREKRKGTLVDKAREIINREDMKKMLLEGKRYKDIAEYYGVGHSQVSQLVLEYKLTQRHLEKEAEGA